jgi:hypothetical protein
MDNAASLAFFDPQALMLARLHPAPLGSIILKLSFDSGVLSS